MATTPYASILNNLKSLIILIHQKRFPEKINIKNDQDISLTLFRMGFLRATYGCRGPKRYSIHKIRHTYPTMMKLGTVIPFLKKIQKIYQSRDKSLEFYLRQHFFTGNQRKFCYIKKYRYRLHFDT